MNEFLKSFFCSGWSQLESDVGGMEEKHVKSKITYNLQKKPLIFMTINLVGYVISPYYLFISINKYKKKTWGFKKWFHQFGSVKKNMFENL